MEFSHGQRFDLDASVSVLLVGLLLMEQRCARALW